MREYLNCCWRSDRTQHVLLRVCVCIFLLYICCYQQISRSESLFLITLLFYGIQFHQAVAFNSQKFRLFLINFSPRPHTHTPFGIILPIFMYAYIYSFIRSLLALSSSYIMNNSWNRNRDQSVMWEELQKTMKKKNRKENNFNSLNIYHRIYFLSLVYAACYLMNSNRFGELTDSPHVLFLCTLKLEKEKDR